ncbi:hypothetical protein [Pseudoalteromonas sp. APC 3694]|uniref:hypothetical protein n=1 Tax=Pseudoalteromonas sp. APC 3694 TaxID=3035202 RepID=UPI0025B4EE15|nr:hypothetical protein [Pseudoalteromonas sp. APC 3694]MDN3490739.1 hypothetical protein [Pseudoalteromonas sp. APC 3694]
MTHANALILRKGMRIAWNRQESVIRSSQPDFLVLEYDDNTKNMVSADKVYDAYSNGEITIVDTAPSVVYMPLTKPEHIKEANRLSAYLKELDSRAHSRSKRTRDSVINNVASRINDPTPPSEGALYRYYDKWIKANRNVIPLIIKPKQQRQKQISQAELDLAYEVIDDEYLQRNGANPHQTYLRFKNRYNTELKGTFDKKCICKESFYKLIRALDPSEVTLAREGKDALRREARKSNQIIITDRLMQRVEIDAVHLNLGLLDDNDHYLGTVILYLAIDVQSRYIVGYKLCYGLNIGEESSAVIDLLKNISLPRKRTGNYQSTWHYLGPPTETFGDAGTAMCSNVVIAFSALLGSSHTTTQAGSPWKKPFIERFNRTLRSQFASKIPGYFGRRVDGKTLDGTIEQKACVTVTKFTEYLEEYICDYYHQNPHKGLDGLTPQQAVESELGYFKPRTIPDVKMIEACTGVEHNVTVQERNGIQVHRVTYRNDELKSIYDKLVMQGKDRKVKILYNKYDISKVMLIVPDTLTLLEIPCRDSRIKPGTSLSDFKAGLPTQTKDSKAFPSKHKNHRPKAKKRKKTVKTKPTEASDKPYTKEELEHMIETGKGRFGQDHTGKELKSTANNETASSKQSKTSGRKRSGRSKVV